MLFSFTFSGFPFDFAQGGEHVEPRISSANGGLVRNDGLKELRHGLVREWRLHIENDSLIVEGGWESEGGR